MPLAAWPSAVSEPGGRRAHNGHTQSHAVPSNQTYNNSADAADAAPMVLLPYRGIQHRFQPRRHSPALFHHGTCGGPPRAHRPCRRFTPFDSCRSSVRSPATFTAPFCVRSDPDEDDFCFSSSVSPSHHGVRLQSCFAAWGRLSPAASRGTSSAKITGLQEPTR